MKTPRPHPSTCLNLHKLKDLRQARGLTQTQLSRLLGLERDGYSIYETGKSHLSLCLFRQLCLALDLDPFTILELLYLTEKNSLIDPQLLKDFRDACLRHGTTPAEALRDFMQVFSNQ
ncbi:MAG: helix-turn-helix domain-containing protein [Syntrophobacterales bacterium]|nr:helix-turn-helix domain-containing protein [Syntrophobacterales bacterium]